MWAGNQLAQEEPVLGTGGQTAKKCGSWLAPRSRLLQEDADGGEGSEKARLYTRDLAKAVKYNCNFDLYESSVANWRDTLYLRIAPNPPADGEMPENCR